MRKWQAAMREHLAGHPPPRRNRTRERLGAGNLPPARTEAPQAAVEAARLRSGDEHTPGEMDEQQLADAIGGVEQRPLTRGAWLRRHGTTLSRPTRPTIGGLGACSH